MNKAETLFTWCKKKHTVNQPVTMQVSILMQRLRRSLNTEDHFRQSKERIKNVDIKIRAHDVLGFFCILLVN
jgi:hypothetical protein